jgi:hypothetical protein
MPQQTASASSRVELAVLTALLTGDILRVWDHGPRQVDARRG